MTLQGELLLEGPRCRRLCLELAMELDQDIRTAVFWLGYNMKMSGQRGRLSVPRSCLSLTRCSAHLAFSGGARTAAWSSGPSTGVHRMIRRRCPGANVRS